MNWSAVQWSILGPALIAGLLVTATHVPLGQRVLRRGIIFLDLAIAQVAGLGLIIAYSFDWEPGGWQVQLVAISAAIVGVLFLNYSDKHWPKIQEPLIGSLFILASSGSVLLLATNPHGGDQLKDLLVGQILWVSFDQIIPVVILYSVILGLWFAYAQRVSSLIFYLLFAVTITASVQLVGIYLVFASLIFPALAIRNVSEYALIYGYMVSVVGYILGLFFAAVFDLPAGAMIVYSLALSAILFLAYRKIKK
ncbi:MAG: zinc/manganese transporter permease [endosymbiont of Galathealinum brachiosum]|uniref:Zinc/manganese transporter permease n=1 Tax=endosymbiont of Galathealinum brachiosum TaxID=2200906 RepID=A0A370DIR1_9GAMM|nr:MAG: zinc/manganese transporter permease [endosymbiont of Galathealinum brachiosum]